MTGPEAVLYAEVCEMAARVFPAFLQKTTLVPGMDYTRISRETVRASVTLVLELRRARGVILENLRALIELIESDPGEKRS